MFFGHFSFKNEYAVQKYDTFNLAVDRSVHCVQHFRLCTPALVQPSTPFQISESLNDSSVYENRYSEFIRAKESTGRLGSVFSVLL